MRKQKLKKGTQINSRKLFCLNYSDNLQVNHKDENKTNNRVDNLEMCDNKYNCTYGTRKTKLAKLILQLTLDNILVKEWPSIIEIRKSLGYAEAAIIACCKGRLRDSHTGNIYPANSAYGYKWKYKQ